MLKKRIIPCLQLINESLVKTINFKNYKYIGDPVNTVRIFNELEVDELCFLDIRASKENKPPNIKILKEISNECFMPLSYGGGVNNSDIAKEILSIGFEKIILNSITYTNPNLVSEIAKFSGNQSVIGSLDFKKMIFGGYKLYSKSGTKKEFKEPVEWAKELENLGAGELLITSIDKEGTWAGFDVEIIGKIANAVRIPVVANGGAGKIEDINELFKKTNVSAIALGSMIVFQKKDMGVLINFPDKTKFNFNESK